MTKPVRFLIIDDDPINNMICKHTIKSALGQNNVVCFTEPEQGLEYIENEISKNGDTTTFLFLDINMPSMTGWEVLDKFKEISESAVKKIKTYILSSSVSQNDRDLAQANPLVEDYIVKPLTREKLLQITQ